MIRSYRSRGEDGRFIDDPDYYKQFKAVPEQEVEYREKRSRCNKCKRFTEQPRHMWYHKNLKLCSCNKPPPPIYIWIP